MYASIHDSVRKLAKKIGADSNGRDLEATLNNISTRLGGNEVHHHGIAPVIDRITEVVDLDIMHNLGTLEVTPTTEAQTITPEAPVDGYSEVSVKAVTSAIDQNIVAGNIKKDVQILGVTGSYEGSGGETFEVTITWGDTITADKTYSEIMTAINADSKVTFTITADGESRTSPGYYVFINEDDVSDDKIIMVSVQSARPLGKIGTAFFGISSNNEIQLIDMAEVTQP